MSKIYTLNALRKRGLIAQSEQSPDQKNPQDPIVQVAEQFSVAVSEHLLRSIEASPNPKQHPMALQFLPTPAELNIRPEESRDPIGEESRSPVKGIVHRYPDRCLLMPLMVCPTYCRFCFRREKVSKKDQSLSSDELTKAYAYIAEHPEIWEVILTGGEPLMLKPEKLRAIIETLNTIDHVKVIRIHTRLPVFDPERITQTLVEALQSPKAVYVALHVNHPTELTEPTINACKRFIQAGIPMLSQTVLLKGINDDPAVIGQLMRDLVSHRIKPYYLHHGELAQGTSHFRTSIKQGQALLKALRGHYSGLCQPTYVLDIPGGYGKVPISSIKPLRHVDDKTGACHYRVEDYQGCEHDYVECL
ncbi:MAG: lysine-2,3-aminomutase-like protein [Gammaproteobacteria bacterium]|nr:lysine-2,3-aminomutase-like protein [Gammaproteobacteria bacterium]MBP9729333.1 lysine-2,3-aminomutase-like protein [Gammaproteobacteria bacterium]